MPAILALRVMLGLMHLLQLYALPIDKTIQLSAWKFHKFKNYNVAAQCNRTI